MEEFFEDGFYDCICDDCGDQYSVDTYPCPKCGGQYFHSIFHVGEYYEE
jgi:hypothetical protein